MVVQCTLSRCFTTKIRTHTPSKGISPAINRFRIEGNWDKTTLKKIQKQKDAIQKLVNEYHYLDKYFIENLNSTSEQAYDEVVDLQDKLSTFEFINF